jgi:hypothetical protein
MGFSVNRAYTGNGTSSAPVGDQLWYDWKAFMKGSGGASDWTVIASGDGLSAISLTTDVISQPAIGANGMANPRSWFILKEPDNGSGNPRRQILVLRPGGISDATGASARIGFYSYEGFRLTGNGFGNAAISSTNPPIAYDMLPCMGTIINNITNSTYTPSQFITADISTIDAAYSLTIHSSANTRYAHFYKSDTAPWCFYLMTTRYNSSVSRHFITFTFAMDAISDDRTDVLSSLSDADPAVFFYCGIDCSGGAVGNGGPYMRMAVTPDLMRCSSIFTAYNPENRGVYSWNLSRTASHSSSISTYTSAENVVTCGLYNPYYTFASLGMPMTNAKLLNSNIDALFDSFWWTAEFANAPGTTLVGQGNGSTNNGVFPTYKGKSSLFKSMANGGYTHPNASISSGGNNYIPYVMSPNSGGYLSQIAIIWDGSALGTSPS